MDPFGPVTPSSRIGDVRGKEMNVAFPSIPEVIAAPNAINGRKLPFNRKWAQQWGQSVDMAP
jgi:hypothetical protein